jgi:hypothetical protein
VRNPLRRIAPPVYLEARQILEHRSVFGDERMRSAWASPLG